MFLVGDKFLNLSTKCNYVLYKYFSLESTEIQTLWGGEKVRDSLGRTGNDVGLHK
jgi:hypothetical protein